MTEGKERRRRRKQVFAVVRLDLFIDGPLENKVTVKEIMPTEVEADAEVGRLNQLQGGREDVKYFVRVTRYYEPSQVEPKG